MPRFSSAVPAVGGDQFLAIRQMKNLVRAEMATN